MDITSVEDDADLPAFDEHQWIATGRKYPDTDIPPEFAQHVQTLLAIPSEIETDILPSPELPVLEFLAYPLPERSTALMSQIGAESAFSKEPPDRAYTHLDKRDIPPRWFVEDAHRIVGQQILDGMSSVRDPQYKNGRHPLWVVTYWMRMHKVLEASKACRNARSWLEKQDRGVSDGTQAEGCIAEAGRILDKLPWNAPTAVKGSGATTFDFLKLLGGGMVSTITVDMMVHWVAEEMETGTHPSSHEVRGLEVWHELRKAEDDQHYSSKQPRFLIKLEQLLLDEGRPLLIPVYLKSAKHFVVIEVDPKR
ncbi:hypothetical protein OF83DRAFT_1179825 [Amylostereum chailletii]|nr:hypothetical protein OF83DRAFT_1179825 [Amylostereum chailletii]